MRPNLLKSAPLGTIALALSIGLHGLLMGLPMPDRTPVAEEDPAETLEPIALRPTVPPIAPPSPIPSPPQAKPKVAPSPQQPKPQQAIVRPAPQPVRPSTPPTIAISPSPQPPAPQPLVSPSPELSPSPSPTPAPFTTDFPHFEDAQAGCYGLETCHQIEGAVSFRDVGRTMMEQLEAKGYTVRLRDDLEDDTGRKVYEVSKDDETRYLSVLSALDLGRTVYVLAAKPMTIEDLQTGNAALPEG